MEHVYPPKDLYIITLITNERVKGAANASRDAMLLAAPSWMRRAVPCPLLWSGDDREGNYT